jgi:hypothetical protein
LEQFQHSTWCQQGDSELGTSAPFAR